MIWCFEVPSKHLLFLSFQTTQKVAAGIISLILLMVSSLHKLHLICASFMVCAMTHFNPKMQYNMRNTTSTYQTLIFLLSIFPFSFTLSFQLHHPARILSPLFLSSSFFSCKEMLMLDLQKLEQIKYYLQRS